MPENQRVRLDTFFQKRHLKHLFVRFANQGNTPCVLKARFRTVHFPVAGISREVQAIYVLCGNRQNRTKLIHIMKCTVINFAIGKQRL